MMDLKEIIRWFIPCFRNLPPKRRKINVTFAFLILFFYFQIVAAGIVKSGSEIIENKHFSLNSTRINEKLVNQSNSLGDKELSRSYETSVGRTFGRPFKKLVGALIPIIFQIGAASTWAVVAALVGVKTLAVTLLILKLLLVAGAAKIGALFASKSHSSHQTWEPHHPQKEIHLHIHNPQAGHHEEHVPFSSWSREGYPVTSDTKNNYVINPYQAGPQTISTPYGNYVKVDSLGAPSSS